MEKSSNKKSDTGIFKRIIAFVKIHKKPILIALGIVLALILIVVIKNAIEVAIEENRDYYISIDDEYTFDCNASYDEKSKNLYCEEREMPGEFSDYETVYISGGVSDRGEGKFVIVSQRSFYKPDYETEDELDFAKIENNLKVNSDVYIYNRRLQKAVFRKNYIINYRLTDADKELIAKKREDWKEWKIAEEKAKAEREAEEAKKKEEAAKAAEEKKKQEEAKKAEEEAKKAEDARKAEEANKTTTITGQDHDENDNAGKFNTIMNACLDKVDSWYPNAYPFDSDDGYPIYYSITVKADGTLVEGSMKGKIKTYHGNKILDYTCNYKDGVAKLKGLDD